MRKSRERDRKSRTLKKSLLEPASRVPYLMRVCLTRSSADLMGVSMRSTVKNAARFAVYVEMRINVKNHHELPAIRPDKDLSRQYVVILRIQRSAKNLLIYYNHRHCIEVKVKVNVDLYSALSWTHTSNKALRYGTRFQGISQFYLHTPHSSSNGMNHTCLCLSSRSWYSFTDPGEMKGWVKEARCVITILNIFYYTYSV